MYGTAVSEARGGALVPRIVRRSSSRARVPLPEGKRSECTHAGLLRYQGFSKSRDRFIKCAPFREHCLSLQQRKKIRRLQQVAVVMGANGRAGSGETRARGDGDWCLVQGWPRRATTPPMCPVRIGCRCVEQMKAGKMGAV